MASLLTAFIRTQRVTPSCRRLLRRRYAKRQKVKSNGRPFTLDYTSLLVEQIRGINYNIRTSLGSQLQSKGKPKLDEKNSSASFDSDLLSDLLLAHTTKF